MGEVDYEELFKQVRHENELLRLFILKLKNSTPTIYQGLKESFLSFYTDETNKRIIRMVLLFTVGMIIYHLITTIVNITIGRFYHER